MPKEAAGISEGDKVSWNWGNGQPGGKAKEIVEEGSAEITSNRGNTIKKNASKENPAVVIEQGGKKNDVVKRASEINESDV